MILITVGGVVVLMLLYNRYRRWRAGKLADKLLEDVIKAKDAFRQSGR